MSGGRFNYDQYRIQGIADHVEDEIIRAEEREHSAEIVDAMKRGREALLVAQVYAHRIDWYLSGDDGPESFLARLQSDLAKIPGLDQEKAP